MHADQLVTRRRVMIVLVAVGAALALGAGSARASTTPSLRFDPASDTSANWAGYAVTSGDPAAGAVPTNFTNVLGSWIQPVATCTAGTTTYSAFWLGLGGYADGATALEQTGTSADCTADGTPVYSVWYELVPAAPVTVKLPVKPGDAISASVSVIKGTTVALRIVNTTQKKVFTKKLTMATPDLSSAEWVAEAPSTCSNFGCRTLPLANFGTVSFSSAMATGNGHRGSITDPAWASTSVSLQGAGPTQFGRGRFMDAIAAANAFPGALSSDGLAFAVAWQQQANVPPVQAPPA